MSPHTMETDRLCLQAETDTAPHTQEHQSLEDPQYSDRFDAETGQWTWSLALQATGVTDGLLPQPPKSEGSG